MIFLRVDLHQAHLVVEGIPRGDVACAPSRSGASLPWVALRCEGVQVRPQGTREDRGSLPGFCSNLAQLVEWFLFVFTDVYISKNMHRSLRNRPDLFSQFNAVSPLSFRHWAMHSGGWALCELELQGSVRGGPDSGP